MNAVIQTSSKPAPSKDTLFAADDGMVAPLSSQECLVQNPRTQERHVMTFEVFQALDQCRIFSTIDEHARRIVDAAPALKSQEEAVRRVVGSFVDRGLMRSAEEVLAELAAAPGRRLAPLGPLFLLCEDRPEGLARALDSLLRSGDPGLDRLPIVVLDGSRSQVAREANRKVVGERRREAGLKYLGNAERAAFVARMQGQMRQHAPALAWLLGDDEAPTRAQLFNWMLLLASGRRALVFDDRQFLPLREMPDARGGIDMRHGQHREAWFHAGEQPIPAQETDAEYAMWSHQAGHYVGQSIGRVVSEVGRLQLAPEALRGMALSHLRGFDPRGRIAALIHGVVGSIEAPHNIWLYQLDPASRERLWSSREFYLRVHEGDHTCHGLSRARLGLASVYQPSAIDASVVTGFALPQAGPRVGPSFGVLTRYFDPESAVLHSTTLVGQQWQPAAKRSEAARRPLTPNAGSFFTDHIQSRAGESRASAPEDRAQFLAALMDDFAASTSDALQNELATYLSYKRAELVSDLQGRLEQVGKDAPIYWEADLREIIQATARELARGSVPRLADWPEHLDAAGAAERLRADARHLAQAVRAWPTAFATATRLAETLLA